MFRITNDQGRTFNVRIVRNGDAYGLDDCLTHDNDEPLVEFYDATYEGPKFGPRGQHVITYNLSTLIDHPPLTGLNLNGGEPAWEIDATAYQHVNDFLQGVNDTPGGAS